ncbi:MAG: PAS domain S-box protein [Syntrophaceae bacterium]|nr:PAS domain S-box protein [Syntrophaceae bacterium]
MKDSKSTFNGRLFAIKNRALELMLDAFVIFDSRGKLTYANPAFLKMIDCAFIEEIQGKKAGFFCMSEDDAKSIRKLLDKNGCWSGEVVIRKKNGSELPVQVSATLIADGTGKTASAAYLLKDITQWMLAEKSLKASEERYRLLADNVTDVIFTVDMNFNYTYVSPSSYRLLGYTPEEAMSMKVADVVTPETFNLLASIFVEEMEIEKRPNRDLTRSRIIEYQHIHKNKSKVWVETTLTFLRNEDSMAVGVLGIVRDISKRKQSEIALADSFEKLRKTLDGTVQAISFAVETRDPYTAGHQRRVAELAVAIASQMGVGDDILQGIRIAGSIHDIGKVAIPTEFLTKPGNIISDIEYTVIKSHAHVGYEILQPIDFPWPIAQIVYQHHERMDGSGYPRGLVGEEILIEARILAVADVVESMASHRPYRIAKGINEALLEIKEKRGVLYDSDVVDACLVVINEKGFEFVSKSSMSD